MRGGNCYSNKKEANPFYRFKVQSNITNYTHGFRICWVNEFKSRNKELKSVNDQTATSEFNNKNNSIPKTDFKMIFVKGGTYIMGNSNTGSLENIQHKVSLNNFYISNLETTNEQSSQNYTDIFQYIP